MPSVQLSDVRTYENGEDMRRESAAIRARLRGTPPPRLSPLAPKPDEASDQTAPRGDALMRFAAEAQLKKRRPTAVTDVVDMVARVLRVDAEEIFSGVAADCAEARRLAMALVVRRFGYTRYEVADFFGVHPETVRPALQVLDAVLIQTALPVRTASLHALVQEIATEWSRFCRRAGVVRSGAYVRDIKQEIAKAFGVTQNDLDSARRTRNLVHPRQIAMCLVKHLTSWSLPQIGAAFGGRDHTTVMHAVRKFSALVASVVATMPPDATPEQWARALHEAHSGISSAAAAA